VNEIQMIYESVKYVRDRVDDIISGQDTQNKDIVEIKKDLSFHIKRTDLLETKVELLKTQIQTAEERSLKVIKLSVAIVAGVVSILSLGIGIALKLKG